MYTLLLALLSIFILGNVASEWLRVKNDPSMSFDKHTISDFFRGPYNSYQTIGFGAIMLWGFIEGFLVASQSITGSILLIISALGLFAIVATRKFNAFNNLWTHVIVTTITLATITFAELLLLPRELLTIPYAALASVGILSPLFFHGRGAVIEKVYAAIITIGLIFLTLNTI